MTSYSEDELKKMIVDAVATILVDQQPQNKEQPEPIIKGIHQLAKFLQVSPARAQKMKNEGLFPYWQDGRTLLFDPKKVREVMFKG